MPGGDGKGASPGDHGEGGDGGEQRGEVGEDADADDRDRNAQVDADVKRSAHLGPLIAGRDPGQVVLRRQVRRPVPDAGQRCAEDQQDPAVSRRGTDQRGQPGGEEDKPARLSRGGG